METIDAHQHYWCYTPEEFGWISDDMKVLRRNFLPDDVQPSMARRGFTGAIAVQAANTRRETNFLLNLARRHTWIRGVVGWIDLEATDLSEQLAQDRSHSALKGYRHIAQDEPDDWFLVRPDIKRGICTLGQNGFTFDLLIYPRQLPAGLQLAEELSEQTLILDHLGKPGVKLNEFAEWAAKFRRFRNLQHVCCKLSGLVTEAHHQNWLPWQFRRYLDLALEVFGPKRLIFGSDWPVLNLAAEYGQVIDLIESWASPLNPQERTEIFGGTAIRAYRLFA